jgi:hypothetical protein
VAELTCNLDVWMLEMAHDDDLLCKQERSFFWEGRFGERSLKE